MTDAERLAYLQGSFAPPTVDEIYLYGLAQQYHTRCEVYDRSICVSRNGSVILGPGGSAVPGDEYQRRAIARYARYVFNDILRTSGVGPGALRAAIQDYMRRT